MTRIPSGRFLAALGGQLLLAGAAFLTGDARGDEPPAVCPKCSAAEQGIPMLSKIPFVSRLFKNVGYASPTKCEAGKCQDCVSNEFERIGVDFDFEVCEKCSAPRMLGSGIVRPQFFVVRSGHIAAPCCEQGCGEESGCGEDCAQCPACCESACQAASHGPLSWEKLIELSATNAALQATLEAQEAFHKEKAQMFEVLAELSQAKAKLEAKVESQAQQAEVTREMLTLVSENARLKAQLEMSESKLALAHELTRLTVENQQLKLAQRRGQVREELVDDVEYFPAPPQQRRPTVPAKADFEDEPTVPQFKR